MSSAEAQLSAPPVQAELVSRAERRARLRAEERERRFGDRRGRLAGQLGRFTGSAAGRWPRWNGRPGADVPGLSLPTVDPETAELLLEPASRRLAESGRFILREIGLGRLGYGRGRTRANIRAVLPGLLRRLDSYRGLRGNLLNWELPGHGLDPKAGDGEWYSIAHDRGSKRDVIHLQGSCGRARCTFYDPETRLACRERWLDREARTCEERIAWARVVTMRHEEPVKHLVVSPRPDIYGPPRWLGHRTRPGYRRLRKLVEEFLRYLGVRGYLIIPHHVRVSRGRWSAAHGCVEGVHFHVVFHGNVRKTPRGGWGELDPRFEGWFAKNLGRRRSVFATVSYLLSHAGIAARANPPGPSPGPVSPPEGETPPKRETSSARPPVLTISWGGDWSPRRFRPPEPLEKAVPVRFCPLCRRLVPEFEWFRCVHLGAGPPPREPVTSTAAEWRAVTLALRAPAGRELMRPERSERLKRLLGGRLPPSRELTQLDRMAIADANAEAARADDRANCDRSVRRDFLAAHGDQGGRGRRSVREAFDLALSEERLREGQTP